MIERRKSDRDMDAIRRKWQDEFWARKREDAKRLADLIKEDK